MTTNRGGRWMAILGVVLSAGIVVRWLALLDTLSNDSGSALLNQPISDSFDDRMPGDFLGAQFASQDAGGLAVVKTLAGAIIYRNLLADNPEVATRLPADSVARDGDILVASVSFPKDMWSDAHFALEHDIESELRLYELGSSGEVTLTATREAPGLTDNVRVQNERLYRKYHVDRIESTDGELYAEFKLAVYDVSDFDELSVTVEGVDLGEVAVLPPMSVSRGQDEVAALALSNENNVSNALLIVDIAGSSPTTETVTLGFEALAMVGFEDRRFALVGEHSVAVVDEASPGDFEVVSSVAVSDTLSSLMDVDGSIAYVLADSSGATTGDGDVLIAFDLDGIAGLVELWRDDIDAPFALTRSVSVDEDKLAVVSHDGVRVYSIAGGEVALITDRARTTMQFVGVESDGQSLFVADRRSGIEVYEHDSFGELVYVETIVMPDGLDCTRGIEVIDEILYAVTSDFDASNELVVISRDGGDHEILARVEIESLIGEWNRTTSAVLGGYENWLLVGMNDRVMLLDVSQPSAPVLLDSIQIEGHVRSLDVGLGGDNHPLVCYSFDLMIECASLDPGSLLEPVGSIDFTIGAGHVRIRGGRLYAAGPMGGVSIASLAESGVVELSNAQPGYVHMTEALEIVGDIALVGSVTGAGVQVFDVSNPSQIEFLGYGDWISFVNLMVWDGASRVYLSSETDIKVLDLSDPENPVVVDTLLGSG